MLPRCAALGAGEEAVSHPEEGGRPPPGVARALKGPLERQLTGLLQGVQTGQKLKGALEGLLRRGDTGSTAAVPGIPLCVTAVLLSAAPRRLA